MTDRCITVIAVWMLCVYVTAHTDIHSMDTVTAALYNSETTDNSDNMISSLKRQMQDLYDQRLSNVIQSIVTSPQHRDNNNRTTNNNKDNALSSRNKRSDYTTLHTSDTGVGVLTGTSSVQKVWNIPAVGAQHVHVFDHGGTLYAVAAFGNGTTEASLLQLRFGVWSEVHRFSSRGTLHFTSFTVNSSRFVIGAEYECVGNRVDKRGVQLYQLIAGSLHYLHTLPQLYPTDIAVWKQYSTTYIGISSFLGAKSHHRRHVPLSRRSSLNDSSFYQQFPAKRLQSGFSDNLTVPHAITADESSGGDSPLKSRQSHESPLSRHTYSRVYRWSDGNFKAMPFVTTGARHLQYFSIHSHHYIAVANYIDDSDNNNIHSEILRYNLATEKYESFQKILTRGAVKIRHFQWGHGANTEHFIVIANQVNKGLGGQQANYHVNSVIYKFHGNQFLPFQCLPTDRVQDILPVWGADSSEFALIVVDSDSLKIYQYTGWVFVLVYSIPLSTPSLNIELDSFFYNRHVHITVGSAVSENNTPAIFRLKFTRQDNVGRVDAEIQQWCSTTHSNIITQWDVYRQLQSSVQAAPKKDDNIEFSSLTVVTSSANSQLNHITVNNMSLTHNFALNDGILDIIDQLKQTTQLSLTSLQLLDHRLEDAVRLDEDHEFTGETFIDGNLTLSSAEIGDLRAPNINSIPNLVDFISNIIYVDDGNILVNGHLHFSNLILPEQSYVLTGVINGDINPANWVTLSSQHSIVGHKHFVQPITANSVIVSQTINNRTINENTTISQNTLPDGRYQYKEINVGNLTTSFINNIDVDNIFNNYVSTQQSQFPDCSFAGTVNINNLNTGSINNINITRLVRKTLKIGNSSSQKITAPWTIAHLIVDNLTLEGTLNKVHVPDDVILIDQGHVTYQLTGVTSQTMHVQHLNVTSNIGPINVIDGKLQILLASSDELQNITSTKKINKLYIDSDWSVGGLINNVTLVDTGDHQTRVIVTNTSFIDSDELTISRVEFGSEVTVDGNVNSHIFSEYLSRFLPLNTSSQLSIVCQRDAQFMQGVTVETINDISPGQWFRTDIESQIVDGEKLFVDISVNKSLHVHLLNNVDLTHLYDNTLLKHSDQIVLGPIELSNFTTFHGFESANFQWAGNNISQLVTKNGNHTITGDKVYVSDMLIGSLSVDNLTVEGLVDTANLTSLMSHANSNTSQSTLTLHNNHSFTGPVSVDHVQLNFSRDSVHNVLGLLLHKLTSHTVVGNVTFINNATVEQLVFDGSMDNVKSEIFGSDWLTHDGGQALQLTSSIVTSSNVTVDDLQLFDTGVINGQTADDLLGHFVSITNNSGHIFITGDVHIAELTSPVLYVDALQEQLANAARKDKVNIFTRPVNFSNQLRINRNLFTSQVNNVTISEMCRKIRRFNDNNIFSVLRVHGNVTLDNGHKLNVNSINNINITSLDQVYWLHDANQTITGNITLLNAQLDSLQNTIFLVDNEQNTTLVDLQSYLENYWHGSRPGTEVTGHVIVDSDLIVGQIVTDDWTVEGYLNGEHLDALFGDILTQNGGNITGIWNISQFIVTDNLNVAEINGRQIDDFISENDQVILINNSLQVDDLQIDGNLVIPEGGTVFGSHVPTVFDSEKYLKKNSSAVINSDVVIIAELVIFLQKLTVAGTINGVNISTVLTSSGEQSKLGSFALSSDQHCINAHIFSDNIRGFDLDKIYNEAARLNGSYNVTGNWNFTNTPSITHTSLSDTDSVSTFIQLYEKARTTLNMVNMADDSTALQYTDKVSHLYKTVQHTASSAPLYLQRFEVTQQWSRNEVLQFVPVTINQRAGDGVTSHLLAVHQNSVSLLHWNNAVPPGTWTEGVRYADMTSVSWAASLTLPCNVTYIAMSRAVSSYNTSDFEPTDSVNGYRRYFDDPVNFIFRFVRGRLELYQLLPAMKSVDVKTFIPSSSLHCFVFVNFAGSGSPLVCNSGRLRDKFFVHQVLPTSHARQAAVYSTVSVNGTVEQCLVIAAVEDMTSWCWSSLTQQLYRHQIIPTSVMSVSTVQFGRTVVLAAAHTSTSKLHGLIDVYSLEHSAGQFSHVQTLPAQEDGVRSVSLLVLPSSELILVTLSHVGRVMYSVYGGHTWFSHFSHFSTPSASSLSLYQLSDQRVQLAAAGIARADMFSLTSRHQTAVFYTARFLGDHW